jgi:serine/threonine protein kinase
VVALSEVQLSAALGAGASGTVYRTQWREQQVAVKLFKSEVSPDGPCAEEVRVVCALQHPCIPRVHALVEDSKGLVMSLIEAKPLADRPDSSRLLRSRYAPQLRFESAGGKSIVGSIATALQYLHSVGICHGDVYAHNVLVGAGPVPSAWLCDFGSAFAYTCSGNTMAFELLEVRAFGILLEEIRQRTELDAHQRGQWTGLEDRILTNEVRRRPGFAVIASQIAEFV